MKGKHFKKATFAFLLALTFLFTVPALARDADESNDNSQHEVFFVEDFLANPEFLNYINAYLVSEYGEKFIENRNTAILIADELLDLFYVRSYARSDVDLMYPEYFGGMYIDDYGNLRILVVKESNSASVSSFSRISKIDLTEVVFSKNELLQIFDDVYTFLNSNSQGHLCEVMQNISGMSLDVAQNRVVVYLRDLSTRQIELFERTVVYHPAIIFSYSSEDDLEDTRLNPGSRIQRRSGAGQSVGYRASLGSGLGFVTTAHGNPPIARGEHFYVSGNANPVGVVQRVSPATDSAFVALFPHVTWSNLPSHNVRPSIQIPILGDIAIRISAGGSGSPHICSGRITSVSHVHNGTFGPILTARATYSRSSGDSGGIIVRPSVNNQFAILGIHVGSHGASGNAVFSTASRITDALSVIPTPY